MVDQGSWHRQHWMSNPRMVSEKQHLLFSLINPLRFISRILLCVSYPVIYLNIRHLSGSSLLLARVAIDSVGSTDVASPFVWCACTGMPDWVLRTGGLDKR